uniref:PHD-type domain-containing protein n=1 Tax=Latimeria chalumnae TaxID=7897 RepID=H2ZW47_LATCH
GKLFIKKGVAAHQNCMLFSSNLVTSDSQDFEDFAGFRLKDVETEIRRGRRLKCSYCKKPGASVGCEVPSCRRSYHYPCAVENGAKIVEEEEEYKYIVNFKRHHKLYHRSERQPERDGEKQRRGDARKKSEREKGKERGKRDREKGKERGKRDREKGRKRTERRNHRRRRMIVTHKKNIKDTEIMECAFCHSPSQNQITGKLFIKKGVAAHQNCMLFSPKLVTRGSENLEDFAGFLVQDVKKEVQRSRRLKCNYCKKNNASIGCDVKQCPRTFHYPCAAKHGLQIVEEEEYNIIRIYCKDHEAQE